MSIFRHTSNQPKPRFEVRPSIYSNKRYDSSGYSEPHGREYPIPPKFPFKEGQSIASEKIGLLFRAAEMANIKQAAKLVNAAAGVRLYEVVIPEDQSVYGPAEEPVTDGVTLYSANRTGEQKPIQEDHTLFQLQGDWRTTSGVHAGPFWDALHEATARAAAETNALEAAIILE